MPDAGSHIYLIGLSGSGKSTVGPMLARRLGREFADSDLLIERQVKMSIPDIFENRGEPWFRRQERDVVSKLSRQKKPLVVALGGGAIQNAEVRRLLGLTGVTVYLSCDIRELSRRLRATTDRPLLVRGGAGKLAGRIQSMMERRRRWYESADIRVSTSKRAARETVSLIVEELRARYEVNHG